MSPDSQGITTLLKESRAGTPGATERLLQLVYPELRRRAALLMEGEREGHTLRPTAVVNEAFVHLFGDQQIDWQDSSHFFALVSREMRRVLTAYARQRLADKRPDGHQRIPEDLDKLPDESTANIEQTIAVGEALEALDRLDQRAALVVDLRFFSGLTEQEVAGIVGVSESTIRQDWRFARIWLKDRLQQPPCSSP